MIGSNEKFPLKHSGEYGSGIIRALETASRSVLTAMSKTTA